MIFNTNLKLREPAINYIQNKFKRPKLKGSIYAVKSIFLTLITLMQVTININKWCKILLPSFRALSEYRGSVWSMIDKNVKSCRKDNKLTSICFKLRFEFA